MKWIKKNWKYLALGSLIIALFMIARVCEDASYRRKIKDLDKEITEKIEENIKLAKEKDKYFKDAQANEKIVASLKIEVAESKVRIGELEKEEAEVETIVAELPPSQLVEDTSLILECAEITLTEDGILFSEECARSNLVRLKKFSLIKAQRDETAFALSKSEEALHFQERVSWNLYGVAWKLGAQILNLKVIGKKKDQKFELSEKHNKKSWLNGLFIGFAIGAGITVIIVIVIPLIKLLI